MFLIFTCVDLFANEMSDLFTEMPNLILIDAKFCMTELKELKIFFRIFERFKKKNPFPQNLIYVLASKNLVLVFSQSIKVK